eukprot:TRINITY_DN4409_c0_g2_i2.p2 TRINITY_DN4409_c0_g2~~TRINITY_DN4409_c0_g2_i2.p2  ORF type:complete len:104 (+),score=13.24 TRINITY_DN4409_c0_g2_i2:1130-1441(+)
MSTLHLSEHYPEIFLNFKESKFKISSPQRRCVGVQKCVKKKMTFCGRSIHHALMFDLFRCRRRFVPPLISKKKRIMKNIIFFTIKSTSLLDLSSQASNVLYFS